MGKMGKMGGSEKGEKSVKGVKGKRENGAVNGEDVLDRFGLTRSGKQL